MSPKKQRRAKFFSGEAPAGEPPPVVGEKHASRDGFEIVDGDGESFDELRSDPEAAGRRVPGNVRPSIPVYRAEPVAPYIEDHAPRRSSLGWAWLTIFVTLILAVGSYWFYEGFDGDLGKVRESFRSFSNRIVPEPRILPLPEATSADNASSPAVVSSNAIDPSAPLPVVQGNSSSANTPASSVPASAPPEGGPADGAPVQPGAANPATLQGVSLTGTPLRSDPGHAVLGQAETAEPQLSHLPTRPRPTEPSAPGDQEESAGGWYRTTPSSDLESAGGVPADGGKLAVVGPHSLIRATPAPQMTPLATDLIGADETLSGETESPLANRGAESSIPTVARPSAASAPGSGSNAVPAVSLPAELRTFQIATPTPTPEPTPSKPSDQGMTQMSVGRVTAGSDLVDLGLVYTSRALAAIDRNFLPPYKRAGASCTISFRIDRNGDIGNVQVARSSGYDPLDSAAQRAVVRSGPLEALAPSVTGSFVNAEATFEF